VVKCLMCKEKVESKDFDFLNFHLLNQHGMTPRHYRQLFPGAKLKSRKMCNMHRRVMFETYKKNPDMNEKKNKWRDEIRERPINYDDLNFDCDTLEALTERKRYHALAMLSGIQGEAYKNAYANFLEARDMLNFLLTGEKRREHPREELRICKPDTSCRKTETERERCMGCVNNDKKGVTLNLATIYKLHPFERTLISAIVETLVHKSIQLSLLLTDGRETSRCFGHIVGRYQWF